MRSPARRTCRREQLQQELTGAITELSGELLELSLLQARARLDAITFEPVDLTPEQGYCIASRHRRDWMNARAALVDSWRLITFNADDLQSDLDFVFSGDIGNVGDNPLAIRGNNGRLRVGLEFDAPLTRLAERNVYRQSLIEYQQARRNYYQIPRRGAPRHSQHAAADAGGPIEFRAAAGGGPHGDHAGRPGAAAALGAGPAGGRGGPGQRRSPPAGESQFGDTVARDLVQALIDLLNVQNDFLSVWVDHEVQRLQLDFDLGIMELDADGQRIEHTQPLRAFLDDGCAWRRSSCRPLCDEATADLPESPDESGSDMLPSLELLPEEPPTGEEVLPPPSGPSRSGCR